MASFTRAFIPQGHPVEEQSSSSPSSLTKRLVDWQVSLDNKHGSTSHLGLFKDMATLPVQDTIDATNYLLWALE